MNLPAHTYAAKQLASERPGFRAWGSLGLLSLLSVLSFVDRFMLTLLVTPLKQDLGLTDIQIGLLFGTTFAAFYGLASLPLARVADASNRKWLVICAVLVWSLCTSLSAFATSFAVLALLRAGLAIGEAALTPTALSLLTDMFPAPTRMLAATLFSCIGMAGAAASYVIGAAVMGLAEPLVQPDGILASWKVWQVSLLLVGVPGIFTAFIMAFVTQEPLRQGASAEVPTARAVLNHAKEKGWLYLGLFGGTGFAQLIANTMAAWSPAYLERTSTLSAQDAGYMFGISQAFAAVGGTLVIPILFRLLVRTGHTVAASRLPAALGFLGALLIMIAPFLGTAELFLGAYAVGGFFVLGVANMSILILQPILPPRMRATLTSVGLICVTAFGMGLGPLVAAAITDLSEGSANPLGWGIAGVAAIGATGAALFYSLSAKRLQATLVEGD